jgi:hypothetical protein
LQALFQSAEQIYEKREGSRAGFGAVSPVLRIRIHMFLDLLDPDPDPLVRGMDPDPEPIIIKPK